MCKRMLPKLEDLKHNQSLERTSLTWDPFTQGKVEDAFKLVMYPSTRSEMMWNRSS
jgi:hypothetical protein